MITQDGNFIDPPGLPRVVATPPPAGEFIHFQPPPGRFWTPGWDHANQQEQTIKGARMADGRIIAFPRLLSRAEALRALAHHAEAETVQRKRRSLKPSKVRL